MIINHPVLNRFSPSIREIAPQSNDDKLIIPNSFSLVGMPPTPLFIPVPGSGNVQESSFGFSHTQIVSDDVALLTQIATIRQGWWEITVSIAYRSNFTVITGGPPNVSVILDNVSSSFDLIALYAATNPASQRATITIQMMIQTNFILSHFLSTNGVGESHSSTVSVHANNLL